MKTLRNLAPAEIAALTVNGCTAESWDSIKVTDGFDTHRICQAHFYGEITLGRNTGTVVLDGLERPCGIERAIIADCQICDNVLISNIGSTITNYIIENEVVIENVASLIAEPGTTFGPGTKASVINEGGSREITLFEDLTAQIAYMQAVFKHESAFQEKLESLIREHIQLGRREKGLISKGARLQHCGVIRNVLVGPCAELDGVTELTNGTISSCPEHPTRLGSGVIAKDFVVTEGATVTDAAVLDKVFIGQGVRVGKQFAAENSVFFANSECFLSEFCSVFAGPYTVSHHKSTLLIAGMFSFYNAGSGTNNSNHAYKLGPVHQGILERGCKTGSFAYLLFGSHLAPFTAVIGQHRTNLDIPNLPFSYLIADRGESRLIPGYNLISVGTFRDGAKWPERDRRKVERKKDLITFEVFSPYTVEKMRRGRDILLELDGKGAPELDPVSYAGTRISRSHVQKGIKYYEMAIDRYLIGKLLDKIEKVAPSSATLADLLARLAPQQTVAEPHRWTDVAGLLACCSKVDRIVANVADGNISTLDELLLELQKLYGGYSEDEWSYVVYAFEKEYGVPIAELNPNKLTELIDEWESAASSLNAMIIEDSKKEFAEPARISYGPDQTEENKRLDFQAVRGTAESNSVVQKLVLDWEGIKARAQKMRRITAGLE